MKPGGLTEPGAKTSLYCAIKPADHVGSRAENESDVTNWFDCATIHKVSPL